VALIERLTPAVLVAVDDDGRIEAALFCA